MEPEGNSHVPEDPRLKSKFYEYIRRKDPFTSSETPQPSQSSERSLCGHAPLSSPSQGFGLGVPLGPTPSVASTSDPTPTTVPTITVTDNERGCLPGVDMNVRMPPPGATSTTTTTTNETGIKAITLESCVGTILHLGNVISKKDEEISKLKQALSEMQKNLNATVTPELDLSRKTGCDVEVQQLLKAKDDLIKQLKVNVEEARNSSDKAKKKLKKCEGFYRISKDTANKRLKEIQKLKDEIIQINCRENKLQEQLQQFQKTDTLQKAMISDLQLKLMEKDSAAMGQRKRILHAMDPDPQFLHNQIPIPIALVEQGAYDNNNYKNRLKWTSDDGYDHYYW